MWFVFFLTFFHSYLLMTNQTTHEYLKKIWRNPPTNPFSYRNFVKNIVSVLFKKESPEQFSLHRPIDMNLDLISISPSREAFNPKIIKKNSIDKLKTDGINSPIFHEKEESKGSLDEIIIPGKI